MIVVSMIQINGLTKIRQIEQESKCRGFHCIEKACVAGAIALTVDKDVLVYYVYKSDHSKGQSEPKQLQHGNLVLSSTSFLSNELCKSGQIAC